MRRPTRRMLVLLLAPVLAWALAPAPATPQAKKLVFWTHWEQNPEFNKYYETRGKDFMYFIEYNLLTAAAVLSILPVLVVFLAAQKWIVRAVVLSGLKG